MFTLHDKILKRAGGRVVSLCLAAAICAGTAMDVHAQPAPPNNNLANAISISGTSGTIYGTNLYATNQVGAPAPYGGGASIWYVWSAPYTTTMSFNTRDSFDPISTDANWGGPLDTILAVYTLTSGTNVAFTNLTPVAFNDDDPSGGVTSRVDFPVSVDQMYLIQALGSPNNPTGANPYAEGTVCLNWLPSLVGGTFGFSASAYFVGEYDDEIPVQEVTHSTDPSLFNRSGANNIRITVTRQGGFTGKCEVTLAATNLTFTNYFETNYTGTNIYTTNYNTDTNGVIINVASYTNTFYTNIASENFFAEFINIGGVPELVYLPLWADSAMTQTNYGTASTNVTGPIVPSSLPLAGLGLTNFFTNWPCANVTSGVTNSNALVLTISITQVFCLGSNIETDAGLVTVPEIITNRLTGSASNRLDYVALTTNLTFNDFQMSQDVYLQINPTGANLPGPDWPDAGGNYAYYGVSPAVILYLSNAALDPEENPDITPPTLSMTSPNLTNYLNLTNFTELPYAFLDILSFSGNPNNYLGSPVYLVTNNSLQEVAVNLERTTFRVNRIPNGGNPINGTNAYLYAVLTGNPAVGNSYTFHYTIDCEGYSGSIGTIPINAFNWNDFATVAESDYAQPSFYGVTNADFGLPVSDPYDPSQNDIGKNTTWPAEKPIIGTFSIGPFPAPNIGEIAIPIFTNGAVEFDMDILVQLFETLSDAQANSGQTVPGSLGNITSANLTINFTGEPGGAYDTSFNIDNSPSSYRPNDQVPGANPPPSYGGSVNAVAIQPNGQAVIGGNFSSYDARTVYGIARLQTNGFPDTTFNNVAGGGVNGYVQAIAIDASGRIIIGGSFTAYNGNSAPNIARLNHDGSLDTTFNSGIGFTNTVYALAIDANGNILVGGDFTSYNTTHLNYIARLLTNGALDTTFLPNTGNGNPNYGTDGDVRAVATDGNGNIILGGEFNSVNGSTYNYVARLLPGGAVDSTFNPEIGPDDTVYSVAIEPNNEILIGGAFQNYNLVSRSSVALLLTTGFLDPNFNPGAGADGVVYSVLLQPNGDVLVGGQFRNFNTSRRLGVARLLPQGWVDTSFMDTAYNQFAGLVNSYNNESVEPVYTAYALALQPDGNIIIGGSFTNVGGGTMNQSSGPVNVRYATHSQVNITRVIGAPTPGPQTGVGGIGNCPGNITLQNTYSVDDTGNKLYVTIDRTNGSLGPAQLTLGTNLVAGQATAADLGLILPDVAEYDIINKYWEILPYGNYGWRQSDGYYGFNNAIQPITDFGDSALNLSIYNDPAAGRDLSATLTELNVNSQGLLVLGGVPIPLYPALGLPSAPLEILNNNTRVGLVGFSATNYTALDTSSNVTITVLRTNGNYGQLTVYYYTTNGSAQSGADYTGVSKQSPPGQQTKLTFGGGAEGNNSYSFTIPIIQKSTVQLTKQFHVLLYAPSPIGVLDTNIPPFVYSNATVTIIDGNFAPGHLGFTSPTYSVDKGGTATVGVTRSGGAVGELQVQCGTSNGTGTNGLNYSGVTNTLFWGDQDVSVKTMTVQTLQDNTVEGPKTVNLSLFNATNVNVGSTNIDNSILTNAYPSNAVLTINEIDSYGTLNFVAPNFNIMQNAGQALITVIRTNGTTSAISVHYTNFSDTSPTPGNQAAQAGTNFGVTSGMLTLTNGQTSANFVVPIYYTPNESSPANRMVTLELYNGNPAAISTNFPIFATLTILDPQLVNHPPGSVDQTTLNGTGFNNVVNSLALQPDGSILAGGDFTFFNQYPFDYVARLMPSGAFDSSFLLNQGGANSSVLQVLSQTPSSSQTNGPIMIVGDFTVVDTVTNQHIARLNLDGSLDETFNPGSGADSTIFAIAETSLPAATNTQPPTLAYYIGGSFANFNGVPCGGITRLNASTNSPGYPGTVDPNFNVGQGVTSSNAAIRALAVQANGQVILGGDFTAFNSVAYNHLVRLNVDGSIDTSFNPSTNFGPADSVRAIAIQPDGQILIGGLFTNVGGSNLNYLARLNSADGSVDTNFNVGVGGNNAVLALAVDSQTRILVGGEFTSFSGVTRSGITRLNPDGTVDPTINFGSGADGGFVDAIAIQSNDEIDVGGGFSTFEGIAENNFVRLFGGANYSDGYVQFSHAVYGVLDNGTNAVISIQRLGGEGTNAQTPVSVVFSTSDYSALAGTQPAQAGIDYTGVTNTVTFPLGETFKTVTIPILNNYLVGSNKSVNLNLSGEINAGVGNQTTAFLVITNVNSAVSFSVPTYPQTANAPGGNAYISVVRVGNPNSTVGVTVYTGTNGTATPYVDYTPETADIVFNPGVMLQDFLVPMLNPTNLFSDKTVDLEMSNPSNTFIASPSSATLIIENVNSGPGVLSFSQPSYSIVAPSAGVTNAPITIVLTDGSSTNVGVTLTTSNGTAVAGINYASVVQTNFLSSGQPSQTVFIPVYAQPKAGPATTVYLTLSNPQNGASIGGAAQEVLTILNGIEGFSFTNSPYTVNESNGSVTLEIVRNGPMTNAASVSYSTFSPPNASEANGQAVPNIDYVPASGTLNFASNETFTTIPITIIQGNAVNGPLTFQVNLNNPSPAGIVQIGSPGTAFVTIDGDVTGFEFSTNSYFVGENGSNIVVTVNRLNYGTGVASVQYATSDGTNLSPALNASNQIDYVATNGTLTFQNNQATASFTVPILNPNIVESNKTFNVTLSNPAVLTLPNPSTNAYLVSPSNATVTITNVLAGVNFESPTYTVSECGVTAAIPVVLIGATNNVVTVNCATTNGGSAIPGLNGGNYLTNSGTLTFSNGQTVQTFYVTVLNNHIIGPNHTVYLALSNPTNAQLLNPSTAVLTIQECNGAYIVNSGTAFVSGSILPASGIIFPNETVKILFGLRDVAGSNATNLLATLQATNGVVPIPAGESQTYPLLIASGPTVSMPFTFEAVGSNGQSISADLVLTEGTNVFTNYFGFTLGDLIIGGGATTTFSTNETLLLFGSSPAPSKAYNTNPPNYGYPSLINVSGLVGNITAVTAGISNFGHQDPANVAVVLESPAAPGQGTVLMNGCGGGNNAQHLDLTFSQSAGSSLPQTTALSNGTYKPTAYSQVLPLGSAPTNLLTSLTNFIGQPPNGTWSLFVADEDTLDSGYISNGWSVSISTEFVTNYTGFPVESDSDLELAITAPAAATQGNTLGYSFSVTNYGPSAATNVTITDALPSGVSYVSNSCNCAVGTNGLTNGVLTFTVASLAVSNGVTFNVVVIPNALGYITNIATATANEPDPNSNNVQSNVVLVSAPSADMGVTLGGSPNPVLDGASVTYSIVAANNGPSTATGVTAINVLPAGFRPSTITPTPSSVVTNANGTVTITWNVGAMGSGSYATLTIIAGVNLPEKSLPSSANLDSVTVSSQVYDPAKLNNYAAIKTEVLPATITVGRSGTNYTLSWQAVPGNIVLQGAVNVTGPWVPIANPVAVGGVYTYVLPGGNGYHFFRLMSQLP